MKAISNDQILAYAQKNAVGLVIIFVAIIITFNLYNKQNADIQTLQADIETETQKNELLGNIAGIHGRIQAIKKELNTKSADKLMGTLNTIAANNNVKITLIKPENEQSYPGYKEYIFSISVSVDNYHLLGKFISVLEAHPDKYKVSNIMVRSDSPVAKPFKLLADMQVSTTLIN